MAAPHVFIATGMAVTGTVNLPGLSGLDEAESFTFGTIMIGMGELLSVGCALAWAIGVVIYRRLGRHLPPLRLALLKNLIVLVLVLATIGILLSPLAMHLGVSPLPWPDLDAGTVAWVLASGLIGIAIADTLYLRALNVLGAGRMGVVGNLYSPFVIALSVAVLDERLGPAQTIGFALVMAGVILVNAPEGIEHVDRRQLRRGVITGALSVALMAVAIVMIKRILETEPFWWIVLIRVVGAVLGLLLVNALMRRRIASERTAPATPVPWSTLIVAALVGQYLSMAMWLAGYKYTTASTASILNETAAIFIVLLAAVFLGERLTPRKCAGVVTTMAGVACMVV